MRDDQPPRRLGNRYRKTVCLRILLSLGLASFITTTSRVRRAVFGQMFWKPVRNQGSSWKPPTRRG
ncbi:hypothetical protein Micbo1qcDRAFT_159524, partial [Microdochium bolleyi]